MATSKRRLSVILLLVMLIGAAYLFGTQKNNTPTSTQTANQTIDADKVIVNNLVINFYSALESQDGKLLFSYFTPPITSQEKEGFTWLTGADLAGTPVYRAFFRQKISSPKIGDTQKIDYATYVVKVSDQLLGIPSAGSETVVYTPQTRNVVLTITKSGEKWMIDKFTDPLNTSNTGNAGSPKYNGFGQ